MRTCNECHKKVPANELTWTHDRYGNPWKKVCGKCEDRVSRTIGEWEFDPADAGESMEADDY